MEYVYDKMLFYSVNFAAFGPEHSRCCSTRDVDDDDGGGDGKLDEVKMRSIDATKYLLSCTAQTKHTTRITHMLKVKL